MTDELSPQSSEQKEFKPSLVEPGGLYFYGSDNLQIASMSAAAGVVLEIRARFMQANGEIIPLTYTHTPNTDRTVKTENYGAGNGWLLSVDIFASGGAPLVGQCFVMFRVIRGLLGDVRELATLCQGPVTSTQRLAWPGAPVQWTTQKPGFIRSILGTDPAAGAQISETVPTGARWRLISALLKLVTDATAANRSVALIVDDGTNVIAEITANAVQVASTTVRYNSSAAGFAGGVGDLNLSIPIPPYLIMQAGWRVRTSTTNMQAADNFGPPQLHVEEWIQGA